MFVELDSLQSARKNGNAKSQIKPLNLPIREDNEQENQSQVINSSMKNANNQKRKKNRKHTVETEFNDTLSTMTNPYHQDFSQMYQREMEQRNVRGSTAFQNMRPIKIKWTFLDERSDFRVNNACKNLKRARRQRIEQAEESALQTDSQTKDSTHYRSSHN